MKVRAFEKCPVCEQNFKNSDVKASSFPGARDCYDCGFYTDINEDENIVDDFGNDEAPNVLFKTEIMTIDEFWRRLKLEVFE